MGSDAACTIRIDGKTARGTAWLEHKDLVFRGPFRLAVPLATITEATSRDGTLLVRFGDRSAELDVGPAAARWAERITNPPSRLQKLGVKPGMRIAIVNVAEASFRDDVERAGATLLTRPAAGMDAVFLGAERPADLDRLESLSGLLQRAGAVWVVRRKGQTAVSERDSMAAGKKAGLVDVKVVSFSETHTAEKYVIPVAKRAAPVPSRSRSIRRSGSLSSRGRS